MSRRLGALEDPLMTAVLNRLLVDPPAPVPDIFLPIPIATMGPNPNILKWLIWPEILWRWRLPPIATMVPPVEPWSIAKELGTGGGVKEWAR